MIETGLNTSLKEIYKISQNSIIILNGREISENQGQGHYTKFCVIDG